MPGASDLNTPRLVITLSKSMTDFISRIILYKENNMKYLDFVLMIDKNNHPCCPINNGKARMNIVRWELFGRLQELCKTEIAYGYETKINRRNANLEKYHYTDAVCIKNFKDTTLTKTIYIVEQKRCNDRCMETFTDAKYIDSRDGKKKNGNELAYIRLSNRPSARVTQKEYVDNQRIYREKKVSPGKITFVKHSYCLKSGDLIYINKGNHKGILAECVYSKRTKNDGYQIFFTYEGQAVDNPSITLKLFEYEQLCENNCEKIKIVRTRRGMIWRSADRIEYESLHNDQYDKKQKAA